MDYVNIAAALQHYRGCGYVYVEDAPWVVGREAYYATRPEGTVDMEVSPQVDGCQYMAASGEQGFIQMMLRGQPLKRAICVTPCFRVERYNDWHRPYFMKAELINAHDTDVGHLIHMIHEACGFFEKFFPVRVVETAAGYDIVEKGTRMELGSYGIRMIDSSVGRLRWIYGTACAEPRLSTVIQRHSTLVGR